MTTRALALEKQARRLPATERERLAERLLARMNAGGVAGGVNFSPFHPCRAETRLSPNARSGRDPLGDG